jgi:hypothetical protein
MVAGCPPLAGKSRNPLSAWKISRPVGLAFWPGTSLVILVSGVIAARTARSIRQKINADHCDERGDAPVGLEEHRRHRQRAFERRVAAFYDLLAFVAQQHPRRQATTVRYNTPAWAP